MTVTINGTTGIAGVDGSAGTPAMQGSDTNTGIVFPAADAVAIATGGVEAVRVNGSGNVGIGVTPSAWGSVVPRALDFQYGGGLAMQTNGTMYINANAYFDGGWKYKTAGAAAMYVLNTDGSGTWYKAGSGSSGGAITWTAPMTLDSSGNLFVSKTGIGVSTAGFAVAKGTVGTYIENNIGDNGTACMYLNQSFGSGTQTAIGLRYNNTTVGSITMSGSATAYNTSSDYRLKEDIAPMTGALAKVEALKPVTYKWKATGEASEGFIAHELQEVVPDCVTGAKDAVDAEGNPVYQGIDTSFLVATLTAAIQEIKVELDAVKAELASLKGA